MRFSRLLIAYAVAIPLALVLGLLVATPGLASFEVMGLVLFFLALPLLLRWDHLLLIFFWNSAFVAAFLPGKLHLWLLFAMLTFGIAAVNHVMGHRRFLRAPELTKPLLLLAAVVILTVMKRGGVGLRALGSGSYGGKHYVYVLGAIVGYFALVSQPIPIRKGARVTQWFFLSQTTFALGNVIYTLGPAFYFLYYFLSSDYAISQFAADYSENALLRFGGLGPAATGLLCFVLARWGIRGVFDLSKPWRLLLLLAAPAAELFSGFRGAFAFLVALLVVQFFVEGLWRTALLPISVGLGILCAAPVLLFANKMPLAVQRTLSFLPVDVSSEARADAAGSSEWRHEMWRVVWPEVPKYLLVGKGYVIDPTDIYLTVEAQRVGLLPDYEEAIVVGNYHNGALSVLMPFGIFGMAAFVWLLCAGVKVLHCNYRHGASELRRINSLLLAYFVVQSLFFFVIFGALEDQLSVFAGLLGLSVSLNGGVRRKAAARAVPATASTNVALQPA